MSKKRNLPKEFAELQAMFDSKEPLHPELKAHIQDGPLGHPGIFHPLMYEIFYMEGMNGLLNKRFEAKKEMQARAVAEKNYSRYVFLFERPYRLNGFMEIFTKLDDKAYWSLLGDIFVDSENIWQNLKGWCVFMASDRKHSEVLMSEEEQKVLAELPEEFTIYRGYQKGKNKRGLSYSLSREKAEWFAKRYKGDALVYERRIKKSQVLAYFSGRNEQEIVIKPKYR